MVVSIARYIEYVSRFHTKWGSTDTNRTMNWKRDRITAESHRRIVLYRDSQRYRTILFVCGFCTNWVGLHAPFSFKLGFSFFFVFFVLNWDRVGGFWAWTHFEYCITMFFRFFLTNQQSIITVQTPSPPSMNSEQWLFFPFFFSCLFFFTKPSQCSHSVVSLCFCFFSRRYTKKIVFISLFLYIIGYPSSLYKIIVFIFLFRVENFCFLLVTCVLRYFGVYIDILNHVYLLMLFIFN